MNKVIMASCVIVAAPIYFGFKVLDNLDSHSYVRPRSKQLAVALKAAINETLGTLMRTDTPSRFY